MAGWQRKDLVPYHLSGMGDLCQADWWTLEIVQVDFRWCKLPRDMNIPTFVSEELRKNWGVPARPRTPQKKKTYLRPFLKNRLRYIWGIFMEKKSSFLVIFCAVTFKNPPNSWRSPSTTVEFGQKKPEKRGFLFWDFFFFLTGVTETTPGCFYFGVFFVRNVDGMFDPHKNDLDRFHPMLRKDHFFFLRSTTTSLMFRAVGGWTHWRSSKEDVFCHYIGTQFWLSRRAYGSFEFLRLYQLISGLHLKDDFCEIMFCPWKFNMDAWPKLHNSMLQKRPPFCFDIFFCQKIQLQIFRKNEKSLHTLGCRDLQ